MIEKILHEWGGGLDDEEGEESIETENEDMIRRDMNENETKN